MNTVKFPKDCKCCYCQAALEFGTPLTKEAEAGIFKGLVIVCSNCGKFMIVGDSNIEPLTVAQFKSLNPEMQRLMGMAKMEIEKRIAKN